MAERAELEGLPGVFELGWLMLMKPVSLFHRLEALGIYQDASFADLWRASSFQSIRRYENQDVSPEDLQRVQSLGRGYVLRIAIAMVLGAVLLTGGLSLILGYLNHGYLNHAFIPTLTAISAIAAVSGVLAALALRTINDAEFWPLDGIITFFIPLFLMLIFKKITDAPITDTNFTLSLTSAYVGATVMTAAILQRRAKLGWFENPISDTQRSLPIPIFFVVMSGIHFLQVSARKSDDINDGIVIVLGLCVALAIFLINIILHKRLPLYPIEVIWQIIAFLIQRIFGWITLSWSPVLQHERGNLPLPTLASHIVDTARCDPELARRALDACAVAPGRRRVGKRAWPRVCALLQATELINLAAFPRPNFEALSELRGEWLPYPAFADEFFRGLQDVGRHLRSAEMTLLPTQRLEQIKAASDRLRQIENALLGKNDFDSRTYRPAIAAWRALIDRWYAETEHAAASVLPNPFRAGDPLDPEFGLPVFRGREPLIAELESILGDPSRGGSLALIGPRRCGKTSLLKMLPLKLPDAQTVFFDVLNHPIDTPAALTAALARTTREQARRERGLSLPDLPGGPPMEALSEWLQRLESFTGIGRILICIDEYERWADLFPEDRRAFLQFLGLIRATIQHRRRVRFLISGATWLDELEPVWADHFVNLRQLSIGHLTHPVVMDLLTRPTADFPPDAIPAGLAQAIWGRTRGQPYLTQLYGQLIVERLNREKRRQATAADCAEVEDDLLDQARAYFSDLVRRAPEPAQEALKALARGEKLDLATLDQASRRYLLRRSLIDESGGLGIPVLGAYLRREEASGIPPTRSALMQWQEIRDYYPQQWLLLEAVKVHSEGDQRILDQLAVLDTFSDSATALNAYARIHREAPERELYVFHTSRDTLDILER